MPRISAVCMRGARLRGLVEGAQLVDQGFKLLEAGGVGVARRRRRDLRAFLARWVKCGIRRNCSLLRGVAAWWFLRLAL